TAVFAVGGDSGDFVGASPERLVRAETGSFDIDVLAGTARRGRNPEEDAHLGAKLLTDVKNGREHTAVLDFVTQTVGPMAADLEIVPSTILRTLSNLHHLSTPIRGRLKQGLGIADLVQALHPTPAMSGTPRPHAIDFVRTHEGFDRGLYSGALGWTNLKGDGDLAVGIRSAHIQGRNATLFAGCGVVAGSDPWAEWEETNTKLLSIRSALGLM